MSRACCALLTSGSTIVLGSNYFVKYVLRVVQHLCTPCNACVTPSPAEKCVYMSKSCQLRRERDTAVAQRGPSENCVYMSKSRHLRNERACSGGVCGGSALVPRAKLPVQDILSVPRHLCRLFISLLGTMCHAAFVPQSVPVTPHPPHRVRPHVVLRRHKGPECGASFSSEASDMYVCNVRVVRVPRVASSCAPGDYTPSLQPGTMPGGAPVWKKCMIKRPRAITGF